jgi:hypothetical protein
MTKQITKWLAILGLTFLVLVVSLWIYARYSFQVFQQAKTRETASVVQRFHEGYNAQQLDEICEVAYGCSVPSFGREGWGSYLRQVRNDVGRFNNVTSSVIRVHIEPPGVRATYVSSFEKTECTEVFDLTFFDSPLKDRRLTYGPLKIVGYRVLIDGKQIPAP